MALAPNCLGSNAPPRQAQLEERFGARLSVPEILYIIKDYLDDALAWTALSPIWRSAPGSSPVRPWAGWTSVPLATRAGPSACRPSVRAPFRGDTGKSS